MPASNPANNIFRLRTVASMLLESILILLMVGVGKGVVFALPFPPADAPEEQGVVDVPFDPAVACRSQPYLGSM